MRPSGRPIIVENRAGAGGILATAADKNRNRTDTRSPRPPRPHDRALAARDLSAIFAISRLPTVSIVSPGKA
jgi:hypothetical protein